MAIPITQRAKCSTVSSPGKIGENSDLVGGEESLQDSRSKLANAARDGAKQVEKPHTDETTNADTGTVTEAATEEAPEGDTESVDTPTE